MAFPSKERESVPPLGLATKEHGPHALELERQDDRQHSSPA
jgi:hypothetical protein